MTVPAYYLSLFRQGHRMVVLNRNGARIAIRLKHVKDWERFNSWFVQAVAKVTPR